MVEENRTPILSLKGICAKPLHHYHILKWSVRQDSNLHKSASQKQSETNYRLLTEILNQRLRLEIIITPITRNGSKILFGSGTGCGLGAQK